MSNMYKDKSIQTVTREYITDGRKSDGSPIIQREKLYASHTDYVETNYTDAKTGLQMNLTEKIIKIDEDIIWAANNAKQMTVKLTGEVVGQATCDDNWLVTLNTKPTKKYAQYVEVKGAVIGNAYADSYDNGRVVINTQYDRFIPQTVKLVDDVTGQATVDKNGLVTISTKVHTSTKVPLPLNDLQWSTLSNAEATFSTCFGGTWECLGNVDVLLTSSNTTILIYLYKKVAV